MTEREEGVSVGVTEKAVLEKVKENRLVILGFLLQVVLSDNL